MKIDRLLNIVVILLQRGYVTAKELAQKFEVSQRTIYRDIEAITMAGIPLYTSKGTNGGIYLDKSFCLGQLPLTETERNCILLALETLHVVEPPGLESAKEKIAAMLKYPFQDWIQIDFTPWGSSRREKQAFSLLRQGILNRQRITFNYIDAQGNQTHREVEPLQLLFMGYTWYLNAYCLMRKDFRTFRISRMRSITLTDQHFPPREIPSKGKEDDDEVTLVPIKLRFSPQVAYRVYDLFDDSAITVAQDHSLEVMIRYPVDEWLYGLILSFGDRVEVMDPPELRVTIQDRLQKTLSIYSTP